MSEVDLLTAAVGIAVWWLWVPSAGNAIKAPTTHTADQTEWLTRLQAQLVVSPDLAAATSKLTAPPPPLAARLARLQTICDDAGIPAAAAVSLLLSQAKQQSEAKRRWRERSGAADVSSLVLAVLPPVLWLASSGMGVSVVDWLVSSLLGWLLIAVFGALTALSRLILRRIAKSALQPVPPRRQRKQMSVAMAAVSAVGLVFSLRPDGLGLLLGATAATIVKRLWPKQSADDLRAQTLLRADRPWLTVLLGSALTAGLDWRRAVRVMTAEAEHQPETLEGVERRLGWGVDPAIAFAEAGADWQPIAISISQAVNAGAPIAPGLIALADHWQSELGAAQLERVERLAARAVIPVSLLQLPAFIVGGLLPSVAVTLQPLLSAWFSTAL